MKNIYCKTLQEYNDLPKTFQEYTVIHIQFSDWAKVEAWENSKVEAWENSNVEAWENSNFEAWGNSKVVARENSKVEAWGNSKVVARENSKVVARENSKVEAWENSKVEAWENVCIRNHSEFTELSLFWYSVCFMIQVCKKLKRKSTTIVINTHYENNIDTFIDMNDVKKLNDQTVLLYKRVSFDYKTQENTKNETLWSVGKILEVPYWSPESECGEGKFHACSRTFFCDQFRSKENDRYIALSVKIDDLYTHKNPQYPHKIAFKKGKVLYEVDRNGNKIS